MVMNKLEKFVGVLFIAGALIVIVGGLPKEIIIMAGALALVFTLSGLTLKKMK